MKNIEELCLELKNAFIFEVKDNINWDVAEFPMEFREGMSAGGLFILKKNEQETGRISIEKFTQVFSILRKLIDPTKINRGTLTIYPDGSYESEFVWDEEAHLEHLLTDLTNSFSWLYEKSEYKIEDSLLPGVEWQEADVILSFKKGKIQLLEIQVFLEQQTKYFQIGIEEIEYERISPELITYYEEMYALSQREDIQKRFQGKWNKAIIRINKALIVPREGSYTFLQDDE